MLCFTTKLETTYGIHTTEVYIPRINQKLEHVFSKGPFFLHQLFNEQGKEKQNNTTAPTREEKKKKIILPLLFLASTNSPHSLPKGGKIFFQINISVSSEVLEFQGWGGKEEEEEQQQLCAMPAGSRAAPRGQSREMMSGALPPLLVMTPASARPEEELTTCVLLSWWLVEVMMLPGVLLVKVEVRLSKNIGGQYCLKQTTKSEETNCTREMYALKIHLPHTQQATDNVPVCA